MEAKKVFAIVIGVALLATAIGFIVTGNFFHHGDEARFNYKHIAYTDEYENITPSAGKYLEIVSVTVKNDGYGDGISVPTLGWKLTADGLTFSQNPILTSQLSKYLPLTIEKGRIWEYEIAFEVPNPEQIHIDGDKIKLDYVYVTTGDELRMRYDGNLKLPDSTVLLETATAVPREFGF